MIINIAGLNGIPTELYDAAKIDGAGSWAQMRHVTLPMVSPVIFYSLTSVLSGVLQFFLVPLILKNGTGEPGGTTLFYNLYIYKNFFTFQHMSYGADAGVGSLPDHPGHHPGAVRHGSPVGLLRRGTLKWTRPRQPCPCQRQAPAPADADQASHTGIVPVVRHNAHRGLLPRGFRIASPAISGHLAQGRDQTAQLGAPLYPADPVTFEYQGRTYDVYQVPIDGTIQESGPGPAGPSIEPSSSIPPTLTPASSPGRDPSGR